MRTTWLYLQAAGKLIVAAVGHPNTDHRIIFYTNRVEVVPVSAKP
jgi:hypothetical protein